MENHHGGATDKITELIDLYPTLADLAGLRAPNSLQGTSLKPLLGDPAGPQWKKELAFTISRSGGESIKTEKWRFTQWGHGENGMELYNLKDDPGEFVNQANNPEFTKILKDMQKRLEAKRKKAGYLAAGEQ